jgi:DNA-binding NarL/FixJ family response regulator
MKQAADAPTRARLDSDSSLCVAVVTDDDDHRNRIRIALELDGIAADGVAVPNGPRRPDAVVMTTELADEGRSKAFQQLTPQLGSIPVVVVIDGGNRRDQRAAMDKGIAALVLWDGLERALAATVRAVCAGQVVVPSALRWQFETPPLSQREKQVLSLVVLGYTNGEIARKLYLAESTVKSHLSSSFGKLGVSSRKEAANVIVDGINGLGTGILAITDGRAA